MPEAEIIQVNFAETAKCPVNRFALFPGRGLCQVIGAIGFDRIVTYRQMDDDPSSETSERVSVRELKQLDPFKDMRDGAG